MRNWKVWFWNRREPLGFFVNLMNNFFKEPFLEIVHYIKYYNCANFQSLIHVFSYVKNHDLYLVSEVSASWSWPSGQVEPKNLVLGTLGDNQCPGNFCFSQKKAKSLHPSVHCRKSLEKIPVYTGMVRDQTSIRR